MNRIIALSMSLMAGTTISAHASHDHITNVQFDGKDCSENKGVYRADQIEFKVAIERRDDVHALLGFYPLPGSEPRARVELDADLVAQPLTFTPQGEDQAYNPSMTIAAYTSKLNGLNIPGFRRFVWNQDGQKKLLKDKTGPVVIFELRNTLKFYDSVVKHDSKLHRSEVYIQYGLEDDRARSEFLVYRFDHERVPSEVNDYLWLNADKNIRTLVSVVYDTLPESVTSIWAEANGFQPLDKYAELEDFQADERLLNAANVDVPEAGLYFKKDLGTPLESKYIYVDSSSKYFMTRLRKVRSELFQAENQSGNGYVFNAVQEQGPELHILGHTPYPLLLDPAAILVPQFNRNGYYRPDSMSWDNSTVNETFLEYPSGHVVVYKSRTQSAFSEADLTNIILREDTNIQDLTECLQNMNLAPKGNLIPKIIVKMRGVQSRLERSDASDRLLPIIEACMASHATVDQTDFGQLVLTDPMLQKFLRPHVESFPKMHLEADTLDFHKVVITNPILEWLWTNRFQFQTLRNVDASKVHLSCIGDNNWPLTKFFELRSIKPTVLNISFDNLAFDDRANLATVIRENPYLSELHFNRPVSHLGDEVLRVIADHSGLKEMTISPDDVHQVYQGLNDAQINNLFLKVRYNRRVMMDFTNVVLSRLTSQNAAKFLRNNRDNVQNLVMGKNSVADALDVIGELKSLERLDSRDALLTPEQSGCLAALLTKSESLREVAFYMHSWSYFSTYGLYYSVRNGLATIPRINSLTLKCGDNSSWYKKEIEDKRAENRALEKITVYTE